MIKHTLVALALAMPFAPFAAEPAGKPAAPPAPAPQTAQPGVNAAEHKYPHKGTRAQCQAAARQQYPNSKDGAKYKAAVAACERA